MTIAAIVGPGNIGTDLLVKLQQVTPFEGKAKVRLIGLPFKVTAPEVEVTKNSKEAVFKIATDKASPAGTHRNLFCQVVLTLGGEECVGNTGSSELRIDVPIVRTTPAPPPVAQPKVDHDALLAEAMKPVSVEDGADVSVAVLDLDSGDSASYGDSAFDTARCVP